MQDRPDRAWLESITPQWDRFLDPRHGGAVGRLMDVYYWKRVAISITVRRAVVYDGTSAAPRVFGDELPDEPPPPQAPPKNGGEARVDTGKVAAHLDRLPHSLLGWVGADALPMVGRVRCHGISPRGLHLSTTDGPLPPGGRRAGLTAHAFRRHMVGQEQRVHTGWLDVVGDGTTYAPHTKAGYAMPGSRTLMTLASVVGMRLGHRKARQLGPTS